jgi:hypothetical protein
MSTRYTHYKPFVPMVNILPEGEHGEAKLTHVEILGDDASFHNMRCDFQPGGHQYRVEPGKYVNLAVGTTMVMSDTQHEQRSCLDIVHEAKGDVLIAGLGLGMILVPILAKPEVTSVTVIEKSADVIALVAPHIHRLHGHGHGSPDLQILEGDIFEWRPPRGLKYDTIWFDIWSDVCTDALPEIAKLHQAFKHYKRSKNSFMSSWKVDELRYWRNVEQREERMWGR